MSLVLALASSIPVLGLERVYPGKAVLGKDFLCPWPWPRALCPRLHLCKFSPNFCPKLGEEQKKKGLHSNLVRIFTQSLNVTHKTSPLCDQTLCPTCKGGGGPCLNFASFDIQFCNPGDPKGWARAQCPP